nr:hypothetical protein [uncultured Flavobacterium sp.]
MNWINTITPENFENSFNLKEILKNSTFYPASGIDATDIEGLSACTNSFVHADYSFPENEVKRALNEDFTAVGYKLIGLKYISEKEWTPNGFKPNNFPLKDSEKERLNYLEQAKKSQNQFCYWAIYEIDETLTSKTTGKINRFSLLHIGGEACATFDALYVNNGINPTGVAILNPSEGYGDNWTKFTDPEYRLFGLMQLNSEKNNVSLPEYVFTNMVNDGICFWPNYELIDKKTFSRPNSKWDECYTFRLK